jgi:hypothetical protein
MKKIIIMLATSTLCLGQAVGAYPRNFGGFYLGAELGGGNLHYEHSSLARHAGAHKVSDKGFAGRLSAGFDINQNLGLELGFLMYQDPEFKNGDHKKDFSQDSLDLLAKFSLPLSCSVSLVGKAGMAYVYRDNIEITNKNVTVKLDDKNKYLRPMLGFQLCYAFNCRVSGNIGYYRTFGTEDLEDADFYGTGLTFKL